MIKDLKELQALLKLCRKQGVTEITLGGTVIKFGEAPRKYKDDGAEEEDQESDEPLTAAEVLAYELGGMPP